MAGIENPSHRTASVQQAYSVCLCAEVHYLYGKLSLEFWHIKKAICEALAIASAEHTQRTEHSACALLFLTDRYLAMHIAVHVLGQELNSWPDKCNETCVHLTPSEGTGTVGDPSLFYYCTLHTHNCRLGIE